MPYIITSKNRTLLIKLDGELDLVTAHEFREAVDRSMEEMLSQNLIIDLTRVTFLDSSGLGVILGRFRKIKARNGQMIIVASAGSIKRILELSGVLSFIPLCSTETEAWKLLEKRIAKEA